MDDFVCEKLDEWGLKEWKSKFKDEDIDEESLFGLEDQDVNDLISKVGPRVRFKKRLRQLKEDYNAVYLSQTLPLPSDREEKRKLDLQGESSGVTQTAKRQQRRTSSMSFSEETILSDVKKIMADVHARLCKRNTKFHKFLRSKIRDLQTEKREVIGVFGKTGAGKSSLINAVVGVKNLLPTGRVSACTSVMINVEANMHNQTFEADVEFITKEEWKDELWSMLQVLQNDVDQQNDDKDDDDDDDEDENNGDKGDKDNYKEKLFALYGEDWKDKSFEQLMDKKCFREIQEFLKSSKKTFTCESAEMLSEEIVKYTRDASNDSDDGKTRSYWPLVKCVTIRVPQNNLLQHVTLIDLPGNGDCNKSRDTMWKRVVGNCSTVWIVAEIKRAASESQCWEILENAASLLGNGGECQRIHFICTMSDTFRKNQEFLPADLDDIKNAKEKVKKKFNNLPAVKKHFREDCFEAFAVSSRDYMDGKDPENNEIPSLQRFLQNLNDQHSETLNYVSGAYGILSLMLGVRDVAGEKKAVCQEIENNKNRQLSLVKKTMDETYSAFEKCLHDGVEKSKSSCEKKLMSTIDPPRKSSRGFHKILKSLVHNGGIHKPKTGKETNLNLILSSFLINSIDEEFRKTFPNEGKCGPFNGVISRFSLGTKQLTQTYKDMKLQLIFVKTEEEKMKADLNKTIRSGKKDVYRCLTETIEETMKECYERAAKFEGIGSMQKQQNEIKTFVQTSKDTMFDKAKDAMLYQLKALMEEIQDKLESTVKKSIEHSLMFDSSIPDVSSHLDKVEKLYDKMKRNSDKEILHKSLTESMKQEPMETE